MPCTQLLRILTLRSKIGSVPTPWPSWLIAASPTRAPPEFLDTFLRTLTQYVVNFGSEEARAGPSVEYIKEKFRYPEEDIKVRVHH